MEQEYGRVVSTPQLTVRDKPYTDEKSKKIGLIPENSIVKILKSKNDYYQIQYGTGYSNTGWVNKAYILVVKGYRR